MRVAEGGDAGQIYSDAARAARQRGVHTLVPLRGGMIALTVAGLLFSVGGLVALPLVADRLENSLGQAAADSLRIGGPAALSAWFASTLLGAMAALAMFIFSLRRHRIDDYHGRYRMWILIALACMVGNLCESSSLPVIAHSLCTAACGACGLRVEIAWPAAIATMVAGLLVRLGIEIRRCGPAMTSLTLASIALLAATAANFGWPVAHSPASLPIWLHGTWLLGYVLLFATLLLYGRRVQVEVAGAAALPVRVKRTKPESRSADAEAEPSAAGERSPRKPALKLRSDLDPVARSTSDEDEELAESPKLVQGGKSQAGNPNDSQLERSGDAKQLPRTDRRKQRQEQRRMAS